MNSSTMSSTQKVTRRASSLTGLRRSHYYGYWLRLKTLGFRFLGSKTIPVGKNNIVYLKTQWQFRRDEETVLITVSRLRAGFCIKLAGQLILRETAASGSALERPFLQYFGQEDKPLFIPRMGKRSKIVREWEQRWLQHMADNKKWTPRLKELGIFNSPMPVQMYKPRPRTYKPRERK